MLVTLISIAIFASGPSHVFASSIEALTNTPNMGDYVISPGKTELTVNPGDKKIKYLIVTNRFGRDMKFKVEIEDFSGSKNVEENIVLLGQERGPYSLKDYLHPDTKEFVLKHGDRITIPVQIDIPADAQPGGLYGSVIITTDPNFNQDSSSTDVTKGNLNVISRLASLYFIRVSGPVNEDGLLRDFSTDRKIYESSPIIFKTLFENKGSIYINPYGKVRVENMSGSLVNELTIAPYFVMPGSVRQKEFNLKRDFMFGRYKATLSLNRGYGNIVDEKTIYFWVLPWKIVGGFAVGLILIIWIAFSIIAWFGKNFERKKK